MPAMSLDFSGPGPGIRRESSALSKAALILGCVSFALFFIAYIGWALDIVLGPVALGISVWALVRAVRGGVGRGQAVAGLLLSLPAFVWACYALTPGASW